MDAHQQQRAASPPPPPPPPPHPPPPPPPPQQGGGGGGGFSAIFTVFLSFIIISCLALVPSSSALKNSLSVVHQVPEGHVGVYWRGGALLKTITDPGFHLKMPLITHFEPIQVTLRTDLVRDIPCGTKGGVMINFEKIEVVNRLRKSFVYETLYDYGVQYDNTWIYDMIHHEINQFCSAHSLQQVFIDLFDEIDEKMKDDLQSDCTRYAPGIEIISVRVTKPTIPESIRRNFEQMEEERTKSYSEPNSLLQTMDAHQQQRAASPPPPPPPPPPPQQGGGRGGFSAIFTVFLSFIKISCLRTIRLQYFLLLKMKEVFSPINNAIGETAAREVLVNCVVKPAVTKLGWEILQHFFVRDQNSAKMVVLFVLLVLVLFYDFYKRASKDSLSGKNY